MRKTLLTLCLLSLVAATPAHARDRGRDGGPADPRNFAPDNPIAARSHDRPMMIPNDARSSHRRQSAKCMNAYPDDHGGFTNCIKEGDNYGSRRQFMPMPGSMNDY